MASANGRTLFLKLATFGILLLWIAGCGGDGSRNSSTGDSVFIFARGADAQKLDPADISDGESVNTLAQVLEGLLGFKSGSFEIEPRLAESYSVSQDGLVYTFRLRNGVVFHDGTPLTAESAAFSFLRQLDPEHPARFENSSFQYWDNLFGDIERLELPDEMTLEFHLKSPNAGILTAFATFPVWLVSPAAYDRFGDQMVFNPVGTGPFVFESWRPNEAIILKRFENYWGAKAGFEKLVIRSIPHNLSRLSELLAGNVHGLDGLQPAELSQLKQSDDFEVFHAPGMNVGYLAFSGLSTVMEDLELRRAIAYAVDRKVLVRLALDGYGSVADYPLPVGFLGEDQEKSPLIHDPEKARKIVEANPHFSELTIQLATFGQPRSYFPDPQKVASLIKNDLEAIGLSVEITNRDFKSHLQITRNGDFDMALLGWIADTPDPDNFLSTFFHSKAARKGSATNISFYTNPEMDDLLDRAIQVSQKEKRYELYQSALDLWWRDLPLVPLVHGEHIVIMNRNIGGYDLSPTGNHYFGSTYFRGDDK